MAQLMTSSSLKMPDTLVIHGPPQSPKERNRARMGLKPHTQGFEQFIDDQERDNTDIKRPMIGCAVTPWRLYPREDE